VLEGSVRKSGNRIRIAVQLVKVADGYHLWSETYDRTLEDVFAVQDDITQCVVQELRTTLMGEAPAAKQDESVGREIAVAAKGRSENSEAYRLMLQGRYLVDRVSHSDFERSIEYLKQAVAIDPEFALAWAWLARALSHSAALGYALVDEANAEALQAARRASALEPDLIEAQMSLCWYQMTHGWDWHDAEASIRRALALAPDNADALSAATMLSYNLGRLDESVAFGRRAVLQDPLNARSYTFLSRPLIALGLLAEAEQVHRKAIELSPDGVGFRYLLALTLERQGRHDEAVAEAMLEKAQWARLTGLAILLFRGGRLPEADKVLQELIETDANDSAYQIAQAYAVRGDPDSAFAWLERAYVQRDSGLGVMKLSWPFEPIHGDPRWAAFLRKMGLAAIHE